MIAPPSPVTPIAVRAVIGWALRDHAPRLASDVWACFAKLEHPAYIGEVSGAIAWELATKGAMLAREARGGTAALDGGYCNDAERDVDRHRTKAVLRLRASHWYKQPCGCPVTDYQGSIDGCGWHPRKAIINEVLP